MFQRNCICENGQDIKERWLIITMACAVYPIIVSLFTLFIPRESPPPIPTISSNLVFFSLLYYFVYRKSRTRFLTFMIFMKLSGFIGIVVQVLITPVQDPRILNYCLTIIDFFLTIGWLFLSFQLRKIYLRGHPLYLRISRKRTLTTKVLSSGEAG